MRPGICTDPHCDGQEATTTCGDGCGQPVCEEHVHRDRESATRYCFVCYQREVERYLDPIPARLYVRGE